MTESDKKKLSTIYTVLQTLHDKENGFNVFRDGLAKLKLPRAEAMQRAGKKEREMAAKHGMENASFDEQIFSITGKEVMENHFCVSCGQAAKAFYYVYEQMKPDLPADAKLDLMVLLSVDSEHKIDGMSGHTLPCVKLSDGKLHAIEPQIAPRKKTDKDPGFDFVSDDVIVGKEIWHTLDSIKKIGRPYIVTKIVTPEYHEETLSDFGRFLRESSMRKGMMYFICNHIESILKNKNLGQYKNINRQVYEFCNALLDKKSELIKILVFTNGERISCRACLKEENTYYNIDLGKKYLVLHKVVDAENANEFFKEPGFKLQQIISPKEYINEFNKRVSFLIQTNNQSIEI